MLYSYYFASIHLQYYQLLLGIILINQEYYNTSGQYCCIDCQQFIDTILKVIMSSTHNQPINNLPVPNPVSKLTTQSWNTHQSADSLKLPESFGDWHFSYGFVCSWWLFWCWDLKFSYFERSQTILLPSWTATSLMHHVKNREAYEPTTPWNQSLPIKIWPRDTR